MKKEGGGVALARSNRKTVASVPHKRITVTFADDGGGLLRDEKGEPVHAAKIRFLRVKGARHSFPGPQGTRLRLDFEAVSWPGTRFKRPPRPTLSVWYVVVCDDARPVIGEECKVWHAPGSKSRFFRDVQIALSGQPVSGKPLDVADIFLGKVFLAELVVVTRGRRRQELHASQHYLKIERLSGLADSHEWEASRPPYVSPNTPIRTGLDKDRDWTPTGSVPKGGA
jgi:hypothetical protein